MGENVPVTPLGNPETERLTLPENPYWSLTSTNVELDEPCPTVALPVESVKLGVPTVSASALVSVCAPDFPVIVSAY